MKIINLVIFDFDGVIFDSSKESFKIIKFLTKFTKYRKLSDEEIKKIWIKTDRDFLEIITQDIPWPFKGWVKKICYQLWKLRKKTRDSKSKFFPETLSVIEKIKNNPNCLVGILTNRTASTLKPVIKQLPLPPEHYFDFIQTSDIDYKYFSKNKIFENHFTSKYYKPNSIFWKDFVKQYIIPQIFALEKLAFIKIELKKHFIGDTLIDFNFAQKCDLKFYATLTGPIDTKEKWIKWTNKKINKNSILTSINELPQKLKIS